MHPEEGWYGLVFASWPRCRVLTRRVARHLRLRLLRLHPAVTRRLCRAARDAEEGRPTADAEPEVEGLSPPTGRTGRPHHHPAGGRSERRTGRGRLRAAGLADDR